MPQPRSSEGPASTGSPGIGEVKQPLLDVDLSNSKPAWLHQQLKGCGSCRCSSVASAAWVSLLFVGIAAAIAIHHAWRPVASPLPPPPERCGVWPDFLPCGRCAYGNMRWPNGSVIRHRVAEGETCETIGRLYNVPAFDIYNRNKSMGCCDLGDSNTSVSDVLDFCAPPSLLQWRAAGHPRQPAAKGVIKSYIGTGSMGLPAPTSLPRSVNVVALGPVDDLPPPNGPAETAHTGVFRVSPTFTGNCSTHIDPTQTVRTMSDVDSSRVWLVTMVSFLAHMHCFYE